MTALTLLIAGAAWLAAYSLFGPPLIVLLAATLSVTSLIGVWSDLRRAASEDKDREVGLQRLGGYEVGE